MAEKKIKIPKQLFVGLRKIEDKDWDSTLSQWIVKGSYIIGDMCEYKPSTQAFEKRMSSIVEDCYGGSRYSHHELRDDGNGLFHVITSTREWKNGVYDYTNPRKLGITVDVAPRVWDNVPLTGFRVLKSITRSATLNKVWIVEDPRGYRFEIWNQSMEEIIMNTTIEKGEILGECIWKSAKNLVPVSIL